MRIKYRNNHHNISDYRFVSETKSEIKLVAVLNNLLDAAVAHGGDAGGAYYGAPEGMQSAMKRAIDFFA